MIRQLGNGLGRLFDWIDRIWLFCRKWMIHVFILWPITGGILWIYVGDERQISDVYDYAVKSPSFWREGIITRPDLRGNTLRLTMADGSERQIYCFMNYKAGASCLFGKEFPITARVELFDYKNAWVILTVHDLQRHTDIVEKKQRMEILRISSKEDAHYSAEEEFLGGAIMGILTIPFGIVFELMARRKERIEAKRRAQHGQ